ncbi:hypothetical protein HK101_000635 [Irineochytrium annulatum]|nr:hypothetical protein HK101_000635 [Irineochytrium annulatum]
MVPAVSTITFFPNPINVDHLRSRVLSVISTNPWLRSRLEGSLFSPKMRYASHPSGNGSLPDDGRHFVDCSDITIDPDARYGEIIKGLQRHVVKPGLEVIGTGGPLFLVTCFRNAVVVSLSHVLGDGHTFYSIYAMLDDRVDIRAMECERRVRMEGRVLSGFIKLAVILPRVLAWALFGRRNITRVGVVRKQYVEAAKADAVKTGAKFVSTNDILTSWIFTKCRTGFGCMAADLRPRLAGLNSDMAGNYTDAAYFEKGGYEVPEMIREGHKRLVNPPAGSSFWKLLTYRTAVVTSWVKDWHDLALPGAGRSIKHLPVLPTFTPAIWDVCVVFRMTADQTAVVTGTGDAVANAAMYEEDGLFEAAME